MKFWLNKIRKLVLQLSTCIPTEEVDGLFMAWLILCKCYNIKRTVTAKLGISFATQCINRNI